MKKILSIALALAIVLTAAVTVFADFYKLGSEPSSYLWLKADENAVPRIDFKIPASAFKEGELKVTAKVCFEDDITPTGADGSGLAFINAYSYSDETKYGEFDYLIGFSDFAASNLTVAGDGDEEPTLIERGTWYEFTYKFDPAEASYGGFKGEVVDGKAVPAMVTVGIGFWQALGTMKIASVSATQESEVLWTIDFSGGFDIENEKDMAKVVYNVGMTAANKEKNWGVVRPVEVIENGVNFAEGCKCTIVGGNTTGDPTEAGGGVYKASLTDGVAVEDKAYTSVWFGFLANSGGAADNAVIETLDGVTTKIGCAVIDLGSQKTFNKVRTHNWAAGVSGIGIFTEIIVHVSNDNKNWTEAGSLVIDEENEVYWAESDDSFPTQKARYVMIEFRYINGVWGFTNEIQIINEERTPSGSDGALGDFDGDKNVTSDDAVYLLRNTLFPDQYPVTGYADFDHDGSVTSDDAVYLLRYTLFPDQYPISK